MLIILGTLNLSLKQDNSASVDIWYGHYHDICAASIHQCLNRLDHMTIVVTTRRKKWYSETNKHLEIWRSGDSISGYLQCVICCIIDLMVVPCGNCYAESRCDT